MGARVICKNCEREMAVMQEGMCGGCFGRAKGLEGSDKLIALAKAREDFKGRGPVGPGNRKPRVKAAGKVPRIPKVEGMAQKDPTSGAIAPAGGHDPELRVEGTASRPDISGADSARKVVRKPLLPPGKIVATTARGGVHTNHSQAELDAYLKAITRNANNEDVPFLSVIVDFTNSDHVLFEGLTALSKKYRRSPDQQLLWLLEHELTNERLLPAKRSEVAHGIDAEVA